jgi:DivIVA domain-containing protein
VVTLLGIVGVLAVIFAAAVVATRDGAVLRPAPPDRADLQLPERGLGPEDLGRVRFGMTLRGYRMSEVDEVLDRAATALSGDHQRAQRLDQELGRALDALRISESRVAALEAELVRRQGGLPSGPPLQAELPAELPAD